MPICRLRDTSLSYLWLGEGGQSDRDPVVLIHGLGASFAFWYPRIALTLAQCGRVLLFDLRGHGRSGMTPNGYTPLNLAADLAALFEALGICRAHVVGHSFGGSIGLAFALQNAALVASLTVVDARIRALQPSAEPTSRNLGEGRPELPARLGADGEVLSGAVGVDLLTALAKSRLHRPDGMQRFGLRPSPFAGVAGKAAALRWLKLVSSTTLSSDVVAPETTTVGDFSRCRFPVLLVYGAFSPAMRSAVAFRQACGGAKLEVVPNAGHFFPLTRPDALIFRLQRFLDRETRAVTINSEDYAAH